ncbi:MAG: hypothetical protein ACLGH8_03975 [Bacteroidia bacterium]
MVTNKGKIYLPETLCRVISALPDVKGIDKSFLAYLIHLIHHQQQKKKSNASGWCHLSSKILKGYEYVLEGIHYSYKKHLDHLENHKLIERSKSYSTVKNRAKGHKINEQLLKAEDVLLPVALTPRLGAKVSIRQEQRKKNARRMTPHLTRWLDKNGFDFDKETAICHTNSLFDLKEDTRIARLRVIEGFDTALYSRDGKDGRLHTNFTRMPSDLRRFVTYQGESLHAIDLPNSQPLMLSILINTLIVGLDREMDCNKPSIESLTKRIGKILKQYCVIADNRTNHNKKVYATANNVITNIKEISYALASIMLSNTFKEFDIQEIKHFHRLSSDKQLYQYVGNKLLEGGIIGNTGKQYTVLLTDEELKTPSLKTFDSIRACGKEITFYALYSSSKNNNKAVKALKELFPAIFRIVDTIKNAIEGNYEVFSWLLLNMESKFILDYSTKRIAKNYSAMPLITIHDSIVTTESDITLLKQEVETDFCKYFGVELSLATEAW